MTPYGDGTGPAGQGPGTGRGRGRCGNRSRQNAGGWRGIFNLFRRHPKPETKPLLQEPAVNQRSSFASVDVSRCTRCGICIEVCPVSAISLQNNETVINRETCIGCGRCTQACPKDALRLMER